METKIDKYLILKLIYNQHKLKYKIYLEENKNLIFFELKSQIYKYLEDTLDEQLPEINSLILTDQDDFIYNEKEKIDSYLKNNDILKIELQLNKAKEITQLPDSIQQQQLQQQQQCNYKEAICVLYDISGSMSYSFFNDNTLSRIGAVNIWFSTFADKTLSFELPHLVQLICFSTEVQQRCGFIDNFDEFIKLVDDVKPTGFTKLYDALEVAIENLLNIQSKYPNIITRIIALTDGEDNKSVLKPQDLVKKIIDNKIIIDSFVVGENCTGLKTLTHASGGRCYCPPTINAGIELFSIETILSVESRDISLAELNPNINLQSISKKPFDLEGIKQNSLYLKQNAAQPEIIIKQYQEQKNDIKPESKRIIKELTNIINDPFDFIKVYPSKDNIKFWKVLMLGPKETSYCKGLFLLSVNLPEEYPMRPPKIKFETNIFHCNISSQGSICLDILKNNWSPALTIQKALLSIQLLLSSPNSDDPNNVEAASLMKHDKQQYENKIKEETLKFACMDSKSFAQQIIGEIINNEEIEKLRIEIENWRTKYLQK